MGFPSPAMDYQEQRLTIDLLCGIDGNCRVIETTCGWAVINVALRPGDALDDVTVYGVLTHTLNIIGEDKLPTI